MPLIQEVCKHRRCTELQTTSDNNYRGQKGVKMYRKFCQKHFELARAKKAGMSPAEYTKAVTVRSAKRAGLSVTEYVNRQRQRAAKRAGLSVTEYIRRQRLRSAQKAGFKTTADHLNSKHKYRKFRKTHCENEDGSITGFKCRTQKTLLKLYPKLLQVDHIDGNPSNHSEKNCQTLCCNCHVVKGEIYGDGKTPGRKTLGEAA